MWIKNCIELFSDITCKLKGCREPQWSCWMCSEGWKSPAQRPNLVIGWVLVADPSQEWKVSKHLPCPLVPTEVLDVFLRTLPLTPMCHPYTVPDMILISLGTIWPTRAIIFTPLWSFKVESTRWHRSDEEIVTLSVVDENTGRCPVCRQDYDSGPRRMLVDSCGHERCYGCMLRMDAGCEQCRHRPRQPHQRPSTVNIDNSTMSGMSPSLANLSCI